MQEIDIDIPARLPPDETVKLIESSCSALDLDRVSRGTLKTYPGCIHWHYKKGRQRGTLEITWWPAKPRLWIKVASGRTAAWIGDVIPLLKHRIETYNGNQI